MEKVIKHDIHTDIKITGSEISNLRIYQGSDYVLIENGKVRELLEAIRTIYKL